MIVLYIVLGIIAALLLAGLVISKDMSAEREVIINKPAAEVFDYIKYLKNQLNYSKWASMDPDIKYDFKGTDGAAGFSYHWTGNKKVGEGVQEITGIEEGKSIATDLQFIKPFKSFAKVLMTVEAVSPDSAKVTWGFKSRMNYPLNVMKLFMNMDKAIGDDFSTGLNNLKALLEK